MAFGWNKSQPSVEEGDDLSSISCISRHFTENAQQANDQGLLERFENEYHVAKQNRAPSSSPAVPSGEDGPASPSSSLPTELFLPIDKRSNRTASTTSSTASVSWCKIPVWSRYPLVLRALFVFCFMCIIVAIGLILFAVIVQARDGVSPEESLRSFDITDWGNSNSNNNGDVDIFVQEGEGGVAGASADDGTASAPSAMGSSPSATPTAVPTFYAPASTLPQTMAKKKQMGANKVGEDKGDKVFDNKSEKERDKKDNNRRKRQRTRRTRKMKAPLVYPAAR